MIGLLLHLGGLAILIWLFCACCYALFWLVFSFIAISMLIIPESLPDWFVIVVAVGFSTLLINLAWKEIIQFFKHPIKFVHDFLKTLSIFLNK